MVLTEDDHRTGYSTFGYNWYKNSSIILVKQLTFAIFTPQVNFLAEYMPIAMKRLR
jgi:hypothetical protein